MQIADYIDADLLDKFEFHNYNHAIEIITQAFPEVWREVTMFSAHMGGEKSGFLATYTLSFIQDKLIRGDAFPAFPLRSV